MTVHRAMLARASALLALALTLLSGCQNAPAAGQSPAPPAAYLPRVTRSTPPQLTPAISMGGVTYALAVDGQRVAVGYGLRVGLVDFADPTAPRLLGEVGPFTDHVRALALRGHLLAVANEREGLKLYDVAEPARARLLGSLPIADQARDVALAGDLAYVAADGAGLAIVNIADPAAPVQVGSLDDPGHDQRVLVQPPVAYLAAGEAGVLAVDVTDPAAPALLGRWDPEAPVNDIALANGHLVAVDDRHLVVLDVADPRQPREAGRLITHGIGQSTRIAGAGTTVYAAAQGLLPVDLRDPARPLVGTAAPVAAGTQAVAVGAGRVYVASRDVAGAHVLDATQPLAPRPAGEYVADGYGAAWELTADGDRLYAQLDHWVHALDAGTWPPAVKALSGLHAQGPMVARGGTLYLGDTYAYGDDPGLVVVDAGDPAHWRELATSRDLISVDDLALGADTLVGLGSVEVTASGWLPQALRGFDVGDPAAPTARPPLALARYARAVDVSADGRWAYVAEDVWSGDVCCDWPPRLAVVDLGRADGPARVAALDLPDRAFGVTVDGARLYAAASDAGVLIYDLGDPVRPRLVGQADTDGEANTIVALGQRLVVGYSDGVRWLDVADPARPLVLAYRHTAEAADRLAVTGNVAWVGLGGLGLLGLRLVP